MENQTMDQGQSGVTRQFVKEEINELEERIEKSVASAISTAIAEAQASTVRWVVTLFIGSVGLMAMMVGAFAASLLLRIT